MEIILRGMGHHWVWVLSKGKKEIAESFNSYSRKASAKRAAENFIRDMEEGPGAINIKS